MAERTSELGTKTQLARLLTQRRITGTDDEIAIAHEINRQSAVKEILVHVFLMAKFRFFNGNLTAVKAAAQYLRGRGNDEAAHSAPGQIVCGVPIQKLIISSNPMLISAATDLRLIVECLFGNTDELHLKFNLADSRAEECGMRDAFGSACDRLATTGKFARFNRAEEFYHHIDDAYRLYKTLGIQGITAAITAQQVKLRAGEPLQGTTRQDLIHILEIYRGELRTSLDTLETVQGLLPESLWREYRRIAQ